MITVSRGEGFGTGVTCGRRKDGSRAVLWSDNEITWYSKDDFEFLAKVFWKVGA